MKRLVIAIDCDDVLIDSTKYVISQYNQYYNTAVKLEGAFSINDRDFGATRTQVLERFNDIYTSENFRQRQPYTEVMEAVRGVGGRHELHIVTARDPILEPVTVRMINEHFPNCFTKIEHVGEGSKGNLCQVLQADVLIDDGFRHLVSAYACGVRDLIWFGNYPWQTEDPKGIPVRRCRDWREVEAEIERIASR